MALTLFNPKTRTFAALSAPQADLPFAELLLLNILIELQTVTVIMSEQSPGLPASSIEQLRSDIVSNT